MTTYVINPITNELESAQPRQRVADKFKLEDLLTPGPLKDELQGDFDPTQETHEEYLRRINLRKGGSIGGGVIQGEKVGDRDNFRAPVLDNPKFNPDMTLEELKKAGIKSRVRYYSPKKGYALVTHVLNKDGRRTGKYETKFFKSHAAREKFADQRLKSQRQVTTKTFDKGRKEAQKIDSNINNWVKDWFKKNSKGFKLGQYEEAMSKFKKDWAKESKNKKTHRNT